jgi:hypothetical protein
MNGSPTFRERQVRYMAGKCARPLPNGLAHSRHTPDAARHIRVIPIGVATWPDEATRTSNSACVWTAEAVVKGRTYTARLPSDRTLFSSR